ncbi:hypothetical protein Tco_1027912, partial [Tanacetum coccineum]
EILLKMNLPDHMSVFTDPEGQVKMETTYNTDSATLRSNIMIKKSVSMQVQRSQYHMKAIFLIKDDQEIYSG